MYTDVQETVYLAELVFITSASFAAGWLLLNSKRKKDQEYRYFGWIFYVIAFIAEFCMLILIMSF